MILFMSWWLIPHQKTLSLGLAVTDVPRERRQEKTKQHIANPAFPPRKSARPFKGALLGVLDKAALFVGHPRHLASLPPAQR